MPGARHRARDQGARKNGQPPSSTVGRRWSPRSEPAASAACCPRRSRAGRHVADHRPPRPPRTSTTTGERPGPAPRHLGSDAQQVRRCRGSGRAGRRPRDGEQHAGHEGHPVEANRAGSSASPPSAPNSTSWWAIRPRSRTPCTWMPSTSAPRAPREGPVGGVRDRRPRPASRRAAAIRPAVARGCARRRVHLVGVVELDDLCGLVEARGLLGEVHHQHRADGEVRRDQHPHLRVGRAPCPHLVEALGGEAGGADDHVDARARCTRRGCPSRRPAL